VKGRARKILAGTLAGGSTLLSYRVRELVTALFLVSFLLLPFSFVAVGLWWGFKRWHAAVRKESGKALPEGKLPAVSQIVD
jgi:hypothetical protein